MVTGQELCRFQGHRGEATSVAFSPDGRTLASASEDSTGLLWDVTGRRRGAGLAPVELTPKELERAWLALAGPDAAKAYQATWDLAAAPEQSLAFLESRLTPAPAVAPQRLAQLIAELDSDEFAVRNAAEAELGKLAEQAVPALRRTLEGRPSAEVRLRAERLPEKAEREVPPAEQLRALRALAVLEYIGTSEARRLLETYSKNAAQVRLAREARAALTRLAK